METTMSRIRHSVTAAAVMALGLLLILSLATPAQAHSTVARHGQDYAQVGPGHNHVFWCDQEADGHRILVYYKTRNGQDHWTDWDGGDAGCGQKTTQSEILYYAVYEEGEGYGQSVWA
jgi:hypothetical protein